MGHEEGAGGRMLERLAVAETRLERMVTREEFERFKMESFRLLREEVHGASDRIINRVEAHRTLTVQEIAELKAEAKVAAEASFNLAMEKMDQRFTAQEGYTEEPQLAVSMWLKIGATVLPILIIMLVGWLFGQQPGNFEGYAEIMNSAF